MTEGNHRAPAYRRVVIKLSGETLGDHLVGEVLSRQRLQSFCEELVEVHRMGVQVGVVVGGGNIVRGSEVAQIGVELAQGHYMGMLATVINALALQSVLEGMSVATRVMSAIRVEQVCEPYIRRRAIRHLEKGRLVIFAGGTGNPFFSTDTAATLRAVEIGAQVIFKATKVDGVYTADPMRDTSARKIPRLTFKEAYERGLGIMDMTAFTMCQENGIPIVVFDVFKKGNLLRAVLGEPVGTLISS